MVSGFSIGGGIDAAGSCTGVALGSGMIGSTCIGIGVGWAVVCIMCAIGPMFGMYLSVDQMEFGWSIGDLITPGVGKVDMPKARGVVGNTPMRSFCAIIWSDWLA